MRMLPRLRPFRKRKRIPVTYTIKKVFKFSDLYKEKKVEPIVEQKYVAPPLKTVDINILCMGYAALRTASDYIRQPVWLLKGGNILLDRFRPCRRPYYGNPPSYARLNYDAEDPRVAEDQKERAVCMPGVRLWTSAYHLSEKQTIKGNITCRLYKTWIYELENLQKRRYQVRIIEETCRTASRKHRHFDPRPSFRGGSFDFSTWSRKNSSFKSFTGSVKRSLMSQSLDIWAFERSSSLLVPQTLKPNPSLQRRPLLPTQQAKLVQLTAQRREGRLVPIQDVFNCYLGFPDFKEAERLERSLFPLLIVNTPWLASAKFDARRAARTDYTDLAWEQRAKVLRKVIRAHKRMMMSLIKDIKMDGDLEELDTVLDDDVFNIMNYEWNTQRYTRAAR